MNYIIVLNFSNYISEEIENKIIPSGLAIIPKIGEWFDPSMFVDENTNIKLEAMGNMGGAIFVRELHHYFSGNIQQIWLILAFTEKGDFYKKKFR